MSGQQPVKASTLQRDPVQPPPVRAGGPTVLLVDDEPDQLSLLTNYFRRAGCDVVQLIDAEHALCLPVSVQPDLMVLDLRLPGIDGWDLARRLQERYPGCPVAITSVLDVEDYPRADGVLPKPVSISHVASLLDRFFPERNR